MTRDEEIEQGLRAAGVPSYVFKTSLAQEGQTELALMIKDGAFTKPDDPTGLFIYPKNERQSAVARRLFYLAAKSMLLRGILVHCVSLPKLAEAIKSDTNTDLWASVEAATHVFITDFYEHGGANPLDPYTAGLVRTWVRAKFEAGHAVSFLSDTEPDSMQPWWPLSFISVITDRTVIKEITA